MASVTGFATGMIAGALWLVFFIGLGLTARNSPGHPFKSIKRFRSSTKSLDLDVPSALQPPAPSGSSEVRIMNPGATPARTTGEWEQPRAARDGDPWDEPKPKSTRQFQRPTLRPVPDLPEPTVLIDPATFFEPDHPRSRPRPVRQELPPVFEDERQFQPTLIETEHPALAQASARTGSGGFGGGEMGGGRMSHQSMMSASNKPPQGPPEPARGPDPGYPTSPGFAPESFPPPDSGPPAPQAGPSLPAFPPPAPFEEPKSGRFGKKGRAKPEKAPKPEKSPKPAAAAPPPAAPAPLVPPAAAREKPKKEKKGLFKPPRPKEAPQAAVPPPPVPPKPVAPPKPRFTAPFNYTPPTSAPPAAPPRYPTTPATGPANRSPWAPPASFSPPATPSFGNWGPKAPEPAPEPPAQSGPASTPPGQPFVPPASPFFGNGNGHGNKVPEDTALESGQWPFGFNAAGASDTSAPNRDPELPAYIELSMFQDPTSADDIAAEQDSETDQPEAEAEEVAETGGAQEAWLADDAWPAPKESRRRWKRDPWPTEDIPPVEETQLLEQHWPENAPEAEEVAVTDWTSPDTPWPGETRRPAEPSWAAEPPEAESQQPPPQWGDEPWQHERPSAPEPVAEQQWTHREPSAEHPATDPWGQEHDRRAASQQPAPEPWGREPEPEPAQQAPEPWSRQPQFAPEAPAEDPWAQARVREVEPVRAPVEPPEHRAPAEPEPAPEPPSNGRQIFVDDEEDWKPLSIDLNLDEDKPAPNPVLEAAARLKAAETAIKVENGLAYVLVDDEGRPVLR